MKKSVLIFALIIGLLTSASTAMAQTVNMSRYITLTVKNGEEIRVDFKAAAAGTPVRIVRGSNTRDITVGTSWRGVVFYAAFGTTMTFYGDLTGFDCNHNNGNVKALDVSNNTLLMELYCIGNRLASLDVSHNTQLKELYCHGNNFNTAALDRIYCALPDRTGTTNGRIYPLNNSSDPNYATVLATNAQNAISKNWKVQYIETETEPNIATTGIYVCGTPPPDMNRYITLTVKNGAAIKLNFRAAAAGTPVRIVSGSNTQDITVGTNWTGTTSYTADGTEMTIYGDLTGFDCSENRANITTLKVYNTQLKQLNCSDNNLTSLDLSNNTQLTILWCHNNRLRYLNVWYNTQLEELSCFSNRLTTLDLSNNTQLKELSCYSNRLTTLDLPNNTQLEELYCHSNNFSTAVLDDIYCSLPDRTGTTYGVIEPVKNPSDPNHATVLATNKQNAIAKNWKVRYYDGETDIPATTGIYVCGTPHTKPNMSRYITLTVKSGKAIKLNFKAATAGTPVRIVSGSNTQNITVGTSWTGFASYTADGTEMKVYGDLIGFNSFANGANITAIDVSNNTQLTELDCDGNGLTSLDVSKNTQLTTLDCYDNRITALDVSNNTQLELLYCSNNRLSNLDVSNNTQLERLYCAYNQLYTLDVSHNTQLERLICYGNQFSTNALDDIYCSLPDRTGKGNGVIEPVTNSSDPDHATVLATNKQNAIAKNWKVQYFDGDTNIPATTGTYVCSTPHTKPNMSRYITLTVAKDSAIKLDFKAATAGTPVCIVSGSNTQDISVDTSWNGFASYTAGSTTMTIYGDLTGFDCSENRAKIIALDPSHNTQLELLYCKNNSISTLDVSKNTQLKGLYCYLNRLYTLDVSKNTQLKGLSCFSNRLTTLDLSNNTQLKRLVCFGNQFSTNALDDIYCSLPIRKASDNAVIYPIYQSTSTDHATVLATNAQNAIDKNWKVQYYDDDTDIPATTGIYVCGTPHPEPNMSRYIILTVKNRAEIQLNFKAAAAGTPVLIVSRNYMRNIIVGTSWKGYAPHTADDTEMIVYGDIIGFACSKNGANLTALDLSNNTQLTELFCSKNNLISLDVSNNTKLLGLNCSDNKLSRLDISSKNTKLQLLFCYGNNLTTSALDDIFCALPDRTGKESGVIQPVYSDTSSNHATVIATNKANAIAKNWNVQYYKNNSDIPATTGKHNCSATDIVEATAEPSLTFYPNPVADILYLSATARTIRVYDMYGTEVAHATDTDRVEVSHLPAGVYTVKADGTVAKMVKR